MLDLLKLFGKNTINQIHFHSYLRTFTYKFVKKTKNQ